jgi:aminomethyltransferase
MKKLALNDRHIELGGRMVDFAGYYMPVSYSNLKEEHLCVRKNVGVFDVSHMGEFIIRGKDALNFVQSISSNDASKLSIGQAQYTCLPNDEGGIVDDMLVYRLGEEMCDEGEQAFMLVVNASNIEKDWNWIASKHKHNCRLINISDQTGLLAVQGPNAKKVLQALTEINLDEISYYHFAKGNFAGIENVLISATGYTGAGGFELYVENSHLVSLWDAVFEAGKSSKIQPIGLGARDTLRLEMGFCLYGNDINDTTSPLEAGLGWITKLKKEADFSSKELFVQQKKEGLTRKLVGFIVADRRVPRHGYELFLDEETKIGLVTSGTHSPSLGIPIGLGYVDIEHAVVGNKIFVQTGRKLLPAEICKIPFYRET